MARTVPAAHVVHAVVPSGLTTARSARGVRRRGRDDQAQRRSRQRAGRQVSSRGGRRQLQRSLQVLVALHRDLVALVVEVRDGEAVAGAEGARRELGKPGAQSFEAGLRQNFEAVIGRSDADLDVDAGHSGTSIGSFAMRWIPLLFLLILLISMALVRAIRLSFCFLLLLLSLLMMLCC